MRSQRLFEPIAFISPTAEKSARLTSSVKYVALKRH
jgi:hypothetical protein